MRIRGPLLVVLVLIFTLQLASGQENCLGHTTNVDSLSIDAGKQGVYSLSFFNLCDNPLSLKFEVEKSPDLRIEIQPEDIILKSEITNTPHSCDDCSWFVLSRGGYPGKYARMQNVKIYVKLPSKISQRLYTIKVIATASPVSDIGGERIKQTLAQVREFRLNIYASGPLSPSASNPDTSGTNYTRIEPSGLVGSEISEGGPGASSSQPADFEVGKQTTPAQAGISDNEGAPPADFSATEEEKNSEKTKGTLPVFEIIVVFLFIIIIVLFIKRE